MFGMDGQIRYSEVSPEGKLTDLSLMDYFQDASVYQSEKLGLGITFFKEHNVAWVLYSWQIEKVNLPRLGTKIIVDSWPYTMGGFYANRNFVMKDTEGNILAKADSKWVLVDLETGRPKRIPQELADRYNFGEQIQMDYATSKLKIPKDFEEMSPFEVPSYFIDTNNHMNNSKYVMLANEYISKDFDFDEIRVEYKKGAMLGEKIYPRVTEMKDKITVVLSAEDKKVYAVVCFIRKEK